ncbi:aminotransferase class I/II-fold pyridoxal phosphate-dependent enzyme [Roseimarinus sediminis]|uniref:aminotransferase class I/II-fold pyridoxal phosphate-dependent enzyme n=1 Tax=Roseimarinus sediminis TaxID=1610899 RepID=UPI003D201D72
MKNTPIQANIVKAKLEALNITDMNKASIREVVEVVNMIEAESGERYVRMEMGVPGLPAAPIGVEAEIAALKIGVASKYPNINGIPELKNEAARFVKNFMNIDVAPAHCVPTSGAMQGTYALFRVASVCDPKKDTALFIDPGFPVQKQQLMVMGAQFESFDVYNYRGEKLRAKLESFLSKGNIHSMIYSNPNNPTWVCFTEEELKIIAELADRYDVIVMEDLAYFGMDFRKDLSKPGQPPYQPSVANYTDNYVLFISASKIFSYAGQRIAMVVMSDKLYQRNYQAAEERFKIKGFGNAVIYRVLYALSSGVTHSTQFALAAMLKAANDARFDFVETLKEYGDRAHSMKTLFTDNGFKILYDKDVDQLIADGFYFTISYPGMDAGELLYRLMFYGISAITLLSTGSTMEGLRACVAPVGREQFPVLKQRLEQFNNDHQKNQ